MVTRCVDRDISSRIHNIVQSFPECRCLPAASRRSESELRSGRLAKTPNEPPSTFISREGVRLGIMTSGNDGVPRDPNEGEKRKSGHPDGTSRRSRPRIDDADGAAVTFGGMFNPACVERNKRLAYECENISIWREKTVCARSPAGLANSSRTVPNGSFSSQNMGAGLKNTIMNSSKDQL